MSPKLPDRDAFYFDLMAPGYGKFSIENFLMESSFVNYDFSSFENALQKGQASEAARIFQKMYQGAQDQVQFLLEYSIPFHEKQHLLDIASTSFGLDLFMVNWFEKVKFYLLLETLRKSGRDVRIPLRKWKDSRDCPKEVGQFLDFYDTGERYFNNLLFAGSKRDLPTTPQPVKEDIILIRIQNDESGVVRPCVGIRRGSKHVVYPLNAEGILEGAAFHMQTGVISLIDPTKGRAFYEIFTAKPEYYSYFATLELARSCCNGNPEKIAEMFQFALMTPLVITRGFRNNLSLEELDPGWRFYELAAALFASTSPDPVISSVVGDLCVRKKWILPGQVVREMMDYIDTFPAGATDMFGRIRKEYVKLMYEPLSARRESPLLGLDYLLSHSLMPPLHRKVKPSGLTEIRRVDEIADATAWLDYLLLGAIQKDALKWDHIHCPIAYKEPPATIPGDAKCSCEAGRSLCFLAGFVDQLGIKFIPLRR